uniref:Uncharacterized protein n=1 Tax=Panagrolaimus sp. ES5 TaxID=591445 RepID=A0AC34GK05_9BILA
DRARQLPTHCLDPKYFNVIVESCREGSSKPDKNFYQRALDKLGVKASESIFIDDLGVNLKSAQEMGFKTIKCQKTADAIKDLEKAIGLSLIDYVSGTRRILPKEALSKDILIPYLKKLFNSAASHLIIRRFGHGQSNPTYYLKFDEKELVLRKKPSGKLLPSAHLIEREYQILKALYGQIPV